MKKSLNLVLLFLLLTSCSKSSESIVDPGRFDKQNTYVVEGKVKNVNGEEILPFNTQMNLTTYSDKVYEKLTPIYDKEIKRLHILFDRYNEYKDENGKIINNLKIINDSYGKDKEIIVDQDLFNILEMSIELAQLTNGNFNPTMGYLIDGWSSYFSPFNTIDAPNLEFTIENEKEIIKRCESIIPYDKLNEVIELDKKKLSVKFNKYSNIEKSIISLGAIGKGYAIDYMRREFSKHDTPLIISGSASSSYIQGKNPNPDRDKWNVQVNSPYKELVFNVPLLMSELEPGKVLSTSGDYEQLFYYVNGDNIIRRHHILDPNKGYSNDYYRSIVLYCDTRSDILDGLSTALFNIENIEDVLTTIENVEDYYDIKIDYLLQKEVSDRVVDLYFNDGFKNTISEYYGTKQDINGIVRVKL